ncbi:hypothetical protein Tco_1519473, partial [Tanacetum coccineum]
IDTFYNILNQFEQDSLNSAAGGNFLTKNTQEALTIIENKSKVQTSRNKTQVASASGSSTQDAHVTALTKQVEALLSLHRSVNSVQNGCETCGVRMLTMSVKSPMATLKRTHMLLRDRPQGVLPSNTVANPLEDLKAITIQSGVTLAGPLVPPPPLSSKEPSPASTSSELPPAPISSPVIPEQIRINLRYHIL